MSTARSLVRLAFAGLFVNVMAVACVVSSSDDDDDATACDPGATKACTCSDGDAGTKKCNASGSGYGACDCSDATNGGSGGGGAGAGGEGNSTTGGTTSGGQSNGGAGGETASQGGAGADSGGAAGAGGAGTDPDAICFENATDDCQECVQVSCCDQWKACNDDTEGDCVKQFFNIIQCTQLDRATRDIKPADLQQCAADEVAGGSAWSDGLLPTTKALVDCTGGGVDWENRAWNDQSCNALCFLQE